MKTSRTRARYTFFVSARWSAAWRARRSAQNPRGGRTSTHAPRPILDGVILTTLATAVLYLVGSLYLEGYYVRLGLPSNETQFPFADIIRASMNPLVTIGGLTLLLAVICLSLNRAERQSYWQPFAPLSTAQALAIVLSVWAAKLVIDFTQGTDSVPWIAWPRRDVIFFVAAVLILVYYAKESVRRSSAHKPRRLRGVTSAELTFLIYCWIFVLFTWMTRNFEWPLKLSDTLLLSAASMGIAVLAFYDWKHPGPETKMDRWFRKPERAPETRLTGGETKGSNLFLGVIAILALLLGSGLSGGIAAGGLLSGCHAVETVTFVPQPHELLANHTYWLILHQGTSYYVRDSNATDGFRIVQPELGSVVHVFRQAKNQPC